MRVKTQAIWLMLFTPFTVGCASRCAPPEAVVAKLRAYYTYMNGLDHNKPTAESFTVLMMGNRTFLRANNLGPYSDPTILAVHIFEGSQELPGLTCPAGPMWVNCVADWVLNPHKDEGKVVYGNQPPPRYTAPAPKEPTCEYVLDVPQWKPSPDDEVKARRATEIFRELQDFGYSDSKEIHIRDFNLNDPEIEAYIVERDGTREFQGCTFDAARFPHCCEWHGFGQSPVDLLRREIMARPYRLYPAPVGRP
jgi:hypothetical protein